MTVVAKRLVVAEDHMMGDINAEIVLIEYGDYQCPHCKEAYLMIKKLQQNLGARFLYIFRHFPVAEIHLYAKRAAIATEAAGAQNKFWEMHNILYENQQKMGAGELIQFAHAIGLDVEKFKADLKDEQFEIRVDKSFKEGRRIGVNFTPTYFLNGKKFSGGSEELYESLQS